MKTKEPTTTPVTQYRLVLALAGLPDMAGQFLRGPQDPAKTKRDGYGFTSDPKEAWPFPTEKQAASKARIVEAHFGEGKMTVEPIPEE